MPRGCANASRIASGVISLNVTRRVFSGSRFAASATCHAIASPSRSRSVARYTRSALRAAFSIAPTCLRRAGNDLVVGAEVVLDVDAELVLAEFLGKVSHVSVRGEDGVAGAEVPLDRLCLGR